jgi:hypothetical protein
MTILKLLVKSIVIISEVVVSQVIISIVVVPRVGYSRVFHLDRLYHTLHISDGSETDTLAY